MTRPNVDSAVEGSDGWLATHLPVVFSLWIHVVCPSRPGLVTVQAHRPGGGVAHLQDATRVAVASGEVLEFGFDDARLDQRQPRLLRAPRESATSSP
jgi:hypothetical protein